MNLVNQIEMVCNQIPNYHRNLIVCENESNANRWVERRKICYVPFVSTHFTFSQPVYVYIKGFH